MGAPVRAIGVGAAARGASAGATGLRIDNHSSPVPSAATRSSSFSQPVGGVAGFAPTVAHAASASAAGPRRSGTTHSPAVVRHA